MIRSGPHQRGFALLIVLWAVVLLALLATGLTSAGRANVLLAANIRDAASAQAAADGAIYQAAFHLLDPTDRWLADKSAHELQTSVARVVVRVENEAGKLNPNFAQPELLQALLVETGTDTQTAERLALSIVEWRFPHDQTRFSGGQPTAYRAAGLEYGPPGAPFESVAEVGAVLGMTPAILSRIEPFLSVFTDTGPDPLAADPVVYRALRRVSAVAPARDGPAPSARLVTIAAASLTGSGSRFVRRAVVRLGATGKDKVLQVLTWQDGTSG